MSPIRCRATGFILEPLGESVQGVTGDEVTRDQVEVVMGMMGMMVMQMMQMMEMEVAVKMAEVTALTLSPLPPTDLVVASSSVSSSIRTV